LDAPSWIGALLLLHACGCRRDRWWRRRWRGRIDHVHDVAISVWECTTIESKRIGTITTTTKKKNADHHSDTMIDSFHVLIGRSVRNPPPKGDAI
jgi:hypothetical protein